MVQEYWLRRVLQVKRKYNMITGIRDASVKLLIKIAVKAEEEEAGVLNMVELLSSPHDQLLARLDLSTHVILSYPPPWPCPTARCVTCWPCPTTVPGRR